MPRHSALAVVLFTLVLSAGTADAQTWSGSAADDDGIQLASCSTDRKAPVPCTVTISQEDGALQVALGESSVNCGRASLAAFSASVTRLSRAESAEAPASTSHACSNGSIRFTRQVVNNRPSNVLTITIESTVSVGMDDPARQVTTIVMSPAETAQFVSAWNAAIPE